jgi:hypothetical protein
MAGLILFSGSLAQMPRQRELTWLHLQFLLGLRRLGSAVLFVDRLLAQIYVDAAFNLHPILDVPRTNLRSVAAPQTRRRSAPS